MADAGSSTIGYSNRTATPTALLKTGRDDKRKQGRGDFSIEILHPGLVRREGDSGIGTIGRIDDASVAPGTLVAMHPHRDDEISTDESAPIFKGGMFSGNMRERQKPRKPCR